MFRDVGSAPVESLAPTIPGSLFAVFELGFALLAPAIITAEIIGDTSIKNTKRHHITIAKLYFLT